MVGGPEWGIFSSWMTGWFNLLGQIAGVASGSYSGAIIIADIVYMFTGKQTGVVGIMGWNAAMLIIAGIVNSFESLLDAMCYISLIVQFGGIFLIVIWMLCVTPKLESPSYVFLYGYNDDTGFSNVFYVALIGSLAATSTFTGYYFSLTISFM